MLFLSTSFLSIPQQNVKSQFKAYNPYLCKKVSEDIYRQIIETGA